MEQLAIDRAKELFGAEHANVQPHSGAQANMAAYLAFLKPGDTLMGLELSHGGHLTHGSPVNFSGLLFRAVSYGVREDTGSIDYDEVRATALAERPQLIIAGGSAYARIIDFAAFRAIADEVGAIFMVDMAHFAGLVAGGVHPSPVPARRHRHDHDAQDAARPARRDDPLHGRARQGDRQGGVPGHAGRAARARHRRQGRGAGRGRPSRVQDVRGAGRAQRAGARGGAAGRGYAIVSGGTDNHLMLVDLRNKGLTGKVAEQPLDRAGITVNKNTVPRRPQSPFVTSGIRIGTPA